MSIKVPSRFAGLTLIEILIVVSIIGMLAIVLSINAVQSGQQSRDAKRQADLKFLQAAVELYKNKYGRYPAQAPTTGLNANGWSGQQGTNFAPADGSGEYIIGLAPEFLPVLPKDPKLNGVNSGYVYRTNTAGTVYKIMAMGSVEADKGLLPANDNDFRPYLHPFKSCDMRARLNADGGTSFLSSESWCNSTAHNIGYGNNAVVLHCRVNHQRFQTSYGVWGGFAPCTGTCAITTGSGANSVEALTEVVICR